MRSLRLLRCPRMTRAPRTALRWPSPPGESQGGTLSPFVSGVGRAGYHCHGRLDEAPRRASGRPWWASPLRLPRIPRDTYRATARGHGLGPGSVALSPRLAGGGRVGFSQPRLSQMATQRASESLVVGIPALLPRSPRDTYRASARGHGPAPGSIARSPQLAEGGRVTFSCAHLRDVLGMGSKGIPCTCEGCSRAF